MLASATSATPWGIDALSIEVEVDIRSGLPQTQIVGLPDTAVRESRERVRAAIKNCGFDLPAKAVVINLAPADLRKAGNQLDLAIALALLAAHGHLPQEALDRRVCCGELGLDGSVRPIRGGLAIADMAATLGVDEVLLPGASALEASSFESVPIIGVDSLKQAIAHLRGETVLSRCKSDPDRDLAMSDNLDLREVRGQETAKRALEIAAAGGHNLLLVGPPGSGKTMLARRLPGLLPPLTRAEAIEVTKIHSAAAASPPSGLIRTRPFRSPHHGISTAGLIGGGNIPRPGEASLSHCGVLFLDELPEFRRSALEALRQPLEGGEIHVVRVRAGFRFPARFCLLAAMNPCKCGHLGDPRHECSCSARDVELYRNRISGPLLDRIDMHIEVPSVTLGEFKGSGGESSRTVSERVLGARERQCRRLLQDPGKHINAALWDTQVREHCRLEATAQSLLDSAFERLGLSARAVTRILKVSRTIADLAGSDRIASLHIAEAIQYRSLDRRATER